MTPVRAELYCAATELASQVRLMCSSDMIAEAMGLNWPLGPRVLERLRPWLDRVKDAAEAEANDRRSIAEAAALAAQRELLR